MPTSGHQPSDSPRRRSSAFGRLLLVAVGAALAVAGLEAWRRSHRPPGIEPGPKRLAEAVSTSYTKGTTHMPKIQKTEAEWRAQLSPEQYEVTRRKGTERAFSGEFWNHHEQGTYKCVGCGAELFSSDTKYDSGCGWPSFFAPGKAENFHTEQDLSHGMARTEVMCNDCGAHLGHLFEDGPLPTGQRYCMNSASLKFEKKHAAQTNKTAGNSETNDEDR